MGPRIALALLVLAAVGDAAETVRICSRSANRVPVNVLVHAEAVASEILAAAEIALDWQDAGRPLCRDAPGARSIFLEFAEEDELALHTLGYTHPYGIPRIMVFFGRIRSHTADQDFTGALLAHVIAHELTHILQGFSRHSSSGIMKPHWSTGDLMRMRREPLHLTPEDVYFIQCARQLNRHESAVTGLHVP